MYNEQCICISSSYRRSNLRNGPLRQSSHETRNTNWTWTSEGQLRHAMESRRKRAIDDTSWATTLHQYWCHLNLSQLPGVAPSPDVSTRPCRSRPSHPRNERGRCQHPGQQRECMRVYIDQCICISSSYRRSNLLNAPLRKSLHDTRNPNWTWRARASSAAPWRAGGSAPPTTQAGQQLHPYWCHLNLS